MTTKIERFLAAFSAIFTILQAIIAITAINAIGSQPLPSVNLEFTFPALSGYLQKSSTELKAIIFIVSEVANAYFFAVVFNILQRKFKGRIHDLVAIFLVLSFTAAISALFLKAIIFDNYVSSFLEICWFSFLYLISLIGTIVLFCYEHVKDKPRNNKNDSIDEILGKAGNIFEIRSLIVLILLYLAFYLLVLFRYVFPSPNIIEPTTRLSNDFQKYSYQLTIKTRT